MDQDTEYTPTPAVQGAEDEQGGGQNPHKRHRSHRGGRHHHSGGNNSGGYNQNRQNPAAQELKERGERTDGASDRENAEVEPNEQSPRNGNRNPGGNNGNNNGNGNGNRNHNRNRNNNNRGRNDRTDSPRDGGTDERAENAGTASNNAGGNTGINTGGINTGGNNGGRNRNRNRNRNRGADRNDRERDDRGNRRDGADLNAARASQSSARTGNKEGDEWVNLSEEEVLPEVSLEELAAISESVLEPRPEVDPGPTVPVVGVRFNEAGKVYYFAPGETVIEPGTFVIVETARGPEYGEVVFGNRLVREKAVIQPLRPILRIATPDDTRHHAENLEREKDAFKTGLERIAAHKLDMKLVDAQYAFDRSKLLFYFTSAGRVDFRELVKDLASIFRTRIELRQIGIRDEAKMLGGIGACGRALCCSTFLPDFAQVSIKMAKEQNLSLNSSKVSGSCGRLMCCLNYEYQTYVDALRRLPTVDSTVRTPEGEGRVIGISALAETVKVSLPGEHEKDDRVVKSFPLDQIELINRAKRAEND